MRNTMIRSMIVPLTLQNLISITLKISFVGTGLVQRNCQNPTAIPSRMEYYH